MNNTKGQTIGRYHWGIGNCHRKARLRSSGLQEVFNPWSMSTHRGRNENCSRHASLSRRKVRYFRDIIAGKLVRQEGVRRNL
jgi:hypothetical protein